MTTTNTAAQKNSPAFELFTIEEKPADKAAAAKQGKVLAENATQRIWTKVGVAFATKGKSGALMVYIGERNDPKQKRYLLCQTSAFDNEELETRLPVGKLFEVGDDGIDFKAKAGIAWLNSDGSYNIVMGDSGDLHQPRFNMRRPRPAAQKPAAKPAAQAAA
jgi:hypothetical protein